MDLIFFPKLIFLNLRLNVVGHWGWIIYQIWLERMKNETPTTEFSLNLFLFFFLKTTVSIFQFLEEFLRLFALKVNLNHGNLETLDVLPFCDKLGF